MFLVPRPRRNEASKLHMACTLLLSFPGHVGTRLVHYIRQVHIEPLKIGNGTIVVHR